MELKTGKKKKPKIAKTHKPENLSLEEWQRALRKQYGTEQDFQLENIGEHPIFSEFLLTNPQSGKTYKLAIRGTAPFANYCSCPDYSINSLGTCKHLEFALAKLSKTRGAQKLFKEGYTPAYSEVYLSYGLKREVRFKAGGKATPKLLSLAKEFFDTKGMLKEGRILDFNDFLNNISAKNTGEVRCYDDVLAYVAERQDVEQRHAIIHTHLKEGSNSPIFDNILKTQLYTYQKEGALFAVKAGRCLLGDDMGLGKTIQALAAAELMAKLFHIQKVLIVSPTSLKYQWRTEIEKFSGRSVSIIEGFQQQRQQLYRQESFYKVINYELVFRDIELIKVWAPDLIILDEAQRIKNWQTRTAQYVKQLESTFAIVLTGTPIENRIEELHSIVEFVDRWHFGPLYKFVSEHRLVDENGKVTGYRNLQKIRNSLKDVMLRRKKDEVLKQLPARIDKNFFVPLTNEQRVIHEENGEIVAKLVAKWRRCKFLNETDQRRLQIALNYMRMAADNTYLVDKRTVHGPKLTELAEILREIVIESGEKVVIFSQWLRMTELVEGLLRQQKIGYAHLNGSVPAKKRHKLMTSFKDDPTCKVFLSTDAGGVGLNLQSGSVVINLDIPWNPAILEQRIGRVHRLGQHKSVRVLNFVTANSIEERILELLKFKRSLFSGALDDNGEDVVIVGQSKLQKFMDSVETMTAEIKKTDPELVQQEQREAVLAEEEPPNKDEILASNDGKEIQMLNNLLLSGAQFLTNLGNVISQSPQKSSGNPLAALIKKDAQTGQNYLHLPLPEPEIMKNVLSTLNELLTHVGKLKNQADENLSP